MIRKLEFIFYIVFCGMMTVILFCTVSNPLNNLLPVPMLLGGILATVLVLLLSFWGKRRMERSGLDSKKTNLILYGMCGIFLISLYAAGLLYGNHWQGVALADYSAVYQGALELSKHQALTQESYFLVYSNNIKPMLVLSWLMKAAYFFGLEKEQILLQFISVLGVGLAIWGGMILVRDTGWRILMLLMYAGCLPVWFFTNYYYTDTFSFGLGIGALAIFQTTLPDKKRGYGWILRGILAAFFLVLGCEIKITVLIPFLALLIVINLRRGRRELPLFRKQLSFGACFLISCICFMILSNRIVNRYEIWEKAKATANPPISWVALGMTGDGSWVGSYEFIHEVSGMETTAQKEEASREYIRENAGELLNPTHLSAKLRFNYASGTFAAYGMLPESAQDNLLWNMFAPYGSLYWRTSQICFVFIWMIYLLYFLGGLRAIVTLWKGGSIPFWLEVCQISFFGMFVFLMLWEANNRQLYNQLPVMIAGAVLNVRFLLDAVKTKR